MNAMSCNAWYLDTNASDLRTKTHATISQTLIGSRISLKRENEREVEDVNEAKLVLYPPSSACQRRCGHRTQGLMQGLDSQSIK